MQTESKHLACYNPDCKTCNLARLKMLQIKPETNWVGLTPWEPLYSKLIWSCCDCGLAHEFWFRNVKGKLMWRAKRHKAQTKLNRKL